MVKVLQGGSFPREGISYFYGVSTWRPPLKDAPVDKLRTSTRIKSIAVEAFGRHLKRGDASALFLFGSKIRPVKTYILVGKRRNCGCFSARM